MVDLSSDMIGVEDCIQRCGIRTGAGSNLSGDKLKVRIVVEVRCGVMKIKRVMRQTE